MQLGSLSKAPAQRILIGYKRRLKKSCLEQVSFTPFFLFTTKFKILVFEQPCNNNTYKLVAHYHV